MIWPFRSQDPTDAASFEKSLSNLSNKIARAQTKDTKLRSSARRYKALWTLYTGFVYTVYAIILVFVTGYERWGPPEYGAIIGGPLWIWGVRMLINAVYDWRIASNHGQLDALKKQKAERVRKFKEATRYDETEKLLEKYGAEVRKVPEERSEGVNRHHEKSRRPSKPPLPPPPRTNLPPPPTANIQRATQAAPIPQPHHTQQPLAPRPHAQSDLQHSSSTSQNRHASSSPPSRQRGESSASFAPNAAEDFPSEPQYAAPAGRQWYDRILDLVLGEDETKPINRIALICRHCKLVNGQAPPGLKEVGRWRCSGCKKWNGEHSDLEEILEDREKKPSADKKDNSTEKIEKEEMSGALDPGLMRDDKLAPHGSMKRMTKAEAADETLRLLHDKYGGADE
ncbi:MAG: hypothetical protein Q9162_007180 [Coniocarpon cinnabarinum]